MNNTPCNVVVTQRFFDGETLRYLEQHRCRAVVADLPAGKGDGDFSEDELCDLLREADGWIVGHARINDALLSRLPRLQVIARRGVGFERVDVEAVKRHGKVATIAVGGNDACVADHAVGMMLALGHRFRQAQAGLSQGNWSIPLGSDLYRKTVAVIGLGRIGRGVVQRLRGFEANIVTNRAAGDAEYLERNRIAVLDMDDLLRAADYVTLHAPLTSETRCMFDAQALARMKKTAFLINTARGGLVDDRALLQALQEGSLAGAGLDVFMSESEPAYKDVSAALIAHPNVIATPHSGASTQEGLQRTNMLAAESVVAVLRGGTPPAERVIADGRR